MSAMGKKFRVVYQIPGIHRVPREMVAVFIGMVMGDRRRNRAAFSGRPEFGTTDLDRAHILSYEEVSMDTKCYVDKKVRP